MARASDRHQSDATSKMVVVQPWSKDASGALNFVQMLRIDPRGLALEITLWTPAKALLLVQSYKGFVATLTAASRQ